jgi:hypothetical protein
VEQETKRERSRPNAMREAENLIAFAIWILPEHHPSPANGEGVHRDLAGKA